MPVRRDTMVAAQYFAAVAGLAAMRHLPSHPSVVVDRLADVRRVVEGLDQFPNNLEIPVLEYDVGEGYLAWAPSYDGPNPAVEADTPVLHDVLSRAPRGRALDAACGTGRLAEHLQSIGYDVLGVDASDAMLDFARAKVPAARFEVGDLHDLPVDDASIDTLVCGLALCHVERLEPVIAEFARVLRPGGWAVVSDINPIALHLGGAAVFPVASDGFELHYVPDLVHECHEYVQAATAAGLTIRECHEPRMAESGITGNPAYVAIPDAVRQAFDGLPSVVIWVFEREP